MRLVVRVPVVPYDIRLVQLGTITRTKCRARWWRCELWGTRTRLHALMSRSVGAVECTVPYSSS
eukprot:scaffold308682_cov17-Prasinocladus_malaysianus.AAC.1